MSVSLEILNNNNSYRTTTATTAKSAKAAESKSVSIPVEESAEKAVANVDSFVHGGGSVRFGSYSKTIVMNDAKKQVKASSSVNKINKSASRSNDVYRDAIKLSAAKRAGISLNPNTGSPNINNSYPARRYYEEIEKMNNVFYCQTGGWNLPDSKQCGRTAAATMVSINSGYTVTPDDTIGDNNGLTDIMVNGAKKHLNTKGSYNLKSGAASGLNKYTCGDEKGVIDAINNELKNGRSVLVKTQVTGQHWVTITGTRDGREASSFMDFMGVDPWYNGNDPNNKSKGTGRFSDKEERAGIIQVGDVADQKVHTDYEIITYRP